MMTMKQVAIYMAALLLTAHTARGQVDLSIENWEEKPVLHKVPDAYAGESAVILEDMTNIRYMDEFRDVVMYKTYHRIIKVLDDKGIESFNKISLPVYNGQTLQLIRSRTILANGTVIEVPKEKMKETQQEDGTTQVAFAMDGVEKGSEVEFIYCYRRGVVLFGEEKIQFGTPVVHAILEISSPARLKFEEKGYNGFPTVRDTLTGDTRTIKAECSNIPATAEEGYSFGDVNRMRAEYKLSYFPEKEEIRQYTWQDLAKKLYSNIYEVSDKEEKAVKKYLESIGVDANEKEEDKIKKIESAIKTGITLYREIKDEEANNLEHVIDNKSATESGLVRLYSACFLKAGVKHEVGLAPDRHEHVFDNDFENWNNVENYLYYFPDQKKFLSPSAIYIRYPFESTDVLNSKGLFCKLTTLGNITDAVADIRTVQPQPVTESRNDITADVSLNADMEATANVSYIFKGYCAMGMREAFILLPKEKIKEMVQNIAVLAQKPEYLLNYTVTGDAFDAYNDNKPLIVNTSVRAAQLVEKAGPKYLFKIGDVIGRQSELYEKDKRKLPVDMDFPHSENRNITVTIPDGYKILNPEAINITAEFKDATGNVGASFYSTYKMAGNKLTVNIAETYSQVHYEIADFEAFRKVINASADFNKVTLLMGKM